MFCPFNKQCSSGVEANCHVVRKGDTFYAISRFYNISLDDLAEANPHIEPEHLSEGQVVSIPPAAPPENCPVGATIYVVQKGDSFYSIARKNKLRLSVLSKANPGVNPDALLTGQSICIPAISSTYTNEACGIKFNYPYRWSRIDDLRYAGIDGFFYISVISSEASLEEVCSLEAHHRLKPYGTNPSVSPIIVGGREACTIMPSADQPKEMRGQSELVISCIKPGELSGTVNKYLILLIDKNHLADIANTLEFLQG